MNALEVDPIDRDLVGWWFFSRTTEDKKYGIKFCDVICNKRDKWNK